MPSQISNSKLNTIRQIASQSGFIKRAFSQGANGISAAQLTMELRQILKLAGVDLPPSAIISLDVVQIVLAGGALVQDIETGAQVIQCVGDISTGVAGVVDLLAQLGLVDPQIADFASLGANVSMVIASDGANVLADIGTVISAINVAGDLSRDFFGDSSSAVKQAKAALKAGVTAVLDPQMKAAAQLTVAYHQGALTVWDLIGGLASKSPISFPRMFPELASYFPSWTVTHVVGQGSSGGLFSSKSATETADIPEILIDKRKLESVIINKYFIEPMHAFEQFETIAPVISLQAISVMALILASGTKGDVSVDFDFDVVQALQVLGLTPYLLGDDWLFKGLQRNEYDQPIWETFLPYPPLKLPPISKAVTGIYVNGEATYTASEIVQNKKAGELEALQIEMQRLDQLGDIDSLVKIPEALAMLKRYGNLHINPVFHTAQDEHDDQLEFETRQGSLVAELINAKVQAGFGDLGMESKVSALQKELAAISRPNTPVGEITNMKLTGASITTQSWYHPGNSTDPATLPGKQFWDYVHRNYSLDLSDYWKCLNVLNTMLKSDLFKDEENTLDKGSSMAQIDKAYKRTYTLYMMKQLNQLARSKLAGALGIPVNELRSRRDRKGKQVFYRKATK